MRTILAVGLFAVCAAGLTAQDDKRYEKDGKFTAKFPTPATAVAKTAGGLTLNIVTSDFDKGKGGFMVTYCDLPPEKLKAPTPEQVLTSSETGLKENFKATVTKSAATTFGPKKYPARELTAERETWNLRGSVVLVGTRLYQVYVYGEKEFVTGKDADAFLASFAITD